MRRTITVAAIVAATLTPGSGQAAASSGCSVATFGYPGMETSCTFTAIGSVDYAAVGTSGWRIMRKRGSGDWVEVATSISGEARPTHINGGAGSIPAQPFDLINISIVRANDSTPAGPISYQHGLIWATSDL